MDLYTKKPVDIEAVQWTGGAEAATPIINWILENGGTARWCDDPAVAERAGQHVDMLAIDTLEGTMWASYGDWIIKGVKGEFYPRKPDIFAETYDKKEIL